MATKHGPRRGRQAWGSQARWIRPWRTNECLF
jgi:hypothetical protein